MGHEYGVTLDRVGGGDSVVGFASVSGLSVERYYNFNESSFEGLKD